MRNVSNPKVFGAAKYNDLYKKISNSSTDDVSDGFAFDCKRTLSEMDITDEQIAMFIDGDLPSSERELVLKLMTKNERIRRKVSDYVKNRRFENYNEEIHKEESSAPIVNETHPPYDIDDDFEDMDFSDFDDYFIPSHLTEKAVSLFKKVIKIKESKDAKEFKPVCINYTKEEYEITGIVEPDSDTLANLELNINKNGQAYKGLVYIYKGKTLYCSLDINEETLSCTLKEKGNYYLYIKDGAIKTPLEMEFELK